MRFGRLSPRMWGIPGGMSGQFQPFRSIPTHVGKPPNQNVFLHLFWVYPHACGETRIRQRIKKCSQGLSPRMWGNPRENSARGCQSEVYPHACGETCTEPHRAVTYRGLSPRMWGNPKKQVQHDLFERSIPTHVGKPVHTRFWLQMMRVYPHACGETPIVYCDTGFNAGLSPRMWGNRCLLLNRDVIVRSIPTHVGKPGQTHQTNRLKRVYPHACGETTGTSRRLPFGSGLSPRMWGNLELQGIYISCSRSIPTHVGKPCLASENRRSIRVYPHACGETYSTYSVVYLYMGLSPRMWGNPQCYHSSELLVRSIPTHVGKPCNNILLY